MICNHSAIFHAMTFGWHRTATLAEVIAESSMVLYATVSISVNPLHVRFKRHVSMVDRTPGNLPCFIAFAGSTRSRNVTPVVGSVLQGRRVNARVAARMRLTWPGWPWPVMASGVWGLVIHSPWSLKSQENQGSARKGLHAVLIFWCFWHVALLAIIDVLTNKRGT